MESLFIYFGWCAVLGCISGIVRMPKWIETLGWLGISAMFWRSIL